MRTRWDAHHRGGHRRVLAGGGRTSSGSPSAAKPSGAGQTSGSTADAAGVWLQFVACARAHGQANWPDPVVDDQGRATFPAVSQQGDNVARPVCDPIRARARRWR